MKILHISTNDISGGAARGAYRLHRGLITSGIDSQMLVQKKDSDDYTIIGPGSKKEKGLNILRPFIDQLPVKFYKKKSKTLFSPSWLGFNNIIAKINKINPDIVHLHWIAGGMIRIEDLAKINIPIVWTLRDMWAFTGGCHYDEWCQGYKKECGNCKVLGSNRKNDLSKKIFNRKKKTFSKIDNITIVGLSSWITDKAKNSSLLKNKKHINLPNLIDTNIFKPLDKDKARELWNFSKDKKLILFGAMSATDDPRKGFKELSEALHKLKDKNIEFVIFGSDKPRVSENFGFKITYLGNLHDDISLATLYNAVDVMVVPSLQEAFGNTALEAISCGTPVVSFACTGLLDIIDHKKNGYLAKPFESSDLAHGIEWVLNNKEYKSLCENAREKVLREFDSKVVAKKYIDLYKKIIEDGK